MMKNIIAPSKKPQLKVEEPQEKPKQEVVSQNFDEEFTFQVFF